ncbi:glycosyltransferase [Lewinella sp. IMCC34183]|uniref:glycosyltransferase n=1 Tax=Lewinella sp. IMCC34183 TaxID=2248762 RepID=UPI0013004F50|nr:glycosyltransferase [Lewinella sp. IMCC34183]
MPGWLAAGPLYVALVYTLWQYRNYRRWRRAVAQSVPPVPVDDSLRLAVVVPFRNEAHNLPVLLEGLLAQTYHPDRYEVILVDDHSEDGGVAGAVLDDERVRLLRLSDHPDFLTRGAYKKAALQLGISHTQADVIVTTDADCRVPPNWLRQLAAHFVAGQDVVLGPVFVDPVEDFWDGFQALDLAAYQLFTASCVAAGKPGLANGANFAFRRTSFHAVGGYAGVNHLPSGDDVLLLHKFIRFGVRAVGVACRPPALVRTRPVTGWRALWRQRLRWASKAGQYGSHSLNWAQTLSFLTSLVILFSFPLGILDYRILLAGLGGWALKWAIDYYLLGDVCRHYGHGKLMTWYPAAQAFYPVYLVAVGTAALFGARASWKGRPGR